jgi:opacity protein-like surface antigen
MALAVKAFAQSSPSGLAELADSEPGFGMQKNEFGIRAGGSWFSGHTWGRAQDRTLALLELRYTRLLFSSRLFALKYGVNLVPVAFLGDHAIFAPTAAQQAEREYVYGGGISPVALQFTFRRGKRIQPFIVTDEGFLYFSRRILDPNSSQFNFTIDYGAGIQVFTSRRRAVTVGYRYYHISNADLAANPGTDANVFFIGVSAFR